MSFKERVLTAASISIFPLLVLIYTFVGILTLDRLNPPTFIVDSLSVDPFNISSSRISANWNIIFCVANPNYEPLTQYFYDVRASILYENESISSTMIEPFSTDHKGKASVPANISVSSLYINDSTAENIYADWSSGSVNFTVMVNSIVTTDSETSKEQRIPVTISCEEVKVDFSIDSMTEGTMVNGSRICKSKWVPDGLYIIL